MPSSGTPIAGQGSANPELREWHTQKLARLPGLKFMRTLWLCNVAGGPFEYVGTKPGREPTGLEEAHRELESRRRSSMPSRPSSPDRSTRSTCPQREKDEVLAAFAAHKAEVTAGSAAAGATA